MLTVLVLAVLIAVSHCAPKWDGDNDFENWKKEFGKNYKDDKEHENRYGIWKKTVEHIEKQNKKGDMSFRMAPNHLSDWTDDERKKLHGAKVPADMEKLALEGGGPVDVEVERVKRQTTTNSTDQLDWRTKGALTPVRNQGQCGSCWAFSTAAAIESRLKIKTGILKVLSPENLVDCVPDDSTYYCGGCDGGWPIGAMKYVFNKTGVNAEADYPYKAIGGTSTTCTPAATKYGALKSPGYVYIRPGNDTALLEAVKVSPVVVTIWASLDSFYSYSSGVYSDPACPDDINHAVLLVGYGTDSATGKPYWLIKNSWGTQWGEQGYFRLARGGSTCGILKYGSAYPYM